MKHFIVATAVVLLVLTAAGSWSLTWAKKKTKNKPAEDQYAEYVWPPPPDEPRIKLEAVFSSRAEVVAKSSFKRSLLELSTDTRYDNLRKPHSVEFDNRGRILVTDTGTAALLRFDLEGRRMDVLGTKTSMSLRKPLGLDVGPDGTIYVTDGELKKVIALSDEGKLVGAYGKQGEMSNPADVALSPDQTRLYVADSTGHKVVVFDLESGQVVSQFGIRGEGDGEFAWPSALAFSPEGDLLVVDQINARVQMFDADGNYLDQFGERGMGFGQFTRPKDIAVDDVGFIYVVDFDFNNVQLFDADFTLLTFIGTSGQNPGQFFGASGVAAHGDRFAVVDQLGDRVQVFRFIVEKDR